MAKRTNKKTTNKKKSYSEAISHLRTQVNPEILTEAFAYALVNVGQAVNLVNAGQRMNSAFTQAATEVFNDLFQPQPRRRLRRKLKFIRKQELNVKSQPRLERNDSHDQNRD